MAIDDLADIRIEQEDPTIAALPREDLDLMVEDGDLAVLTGADVVQAALIRRLRTPLGSYGILIGSLDDQGYWAITRMGTSYGSDMGRMISEPLTNAWIRSFISLITATLSSDTRIRLANIDVDIFDPSRGMVRFIIEYEIVDDGAAGTLTLETSPGTFSVVGG